MHYTSSARLLVRCFESVWSGIDLGLGFVVATVTFNTPPSSHFSGVTFCLWQLWAY